MIIHNNCGRASGINLHTIINTHIILLICFAYLLFEAEHWDLLPRSVRTELRRAESTISLARGAARIHSFKRENRNYPQFMLAAPEYPHFVPQIMADARCPHRLGVWAREFYDNDTMTFGDAQSLACLEHILKDGKDETVAIEKGHSTFRQFLVVRSAQCKVVDIEELNNFWILRMFKELSPGFWKAPPVPKVSKKEVSGREGRRRSRRNHTL